MDTPVTSEVVMASDDGAIITEAGTQLQTSEDGVSEMVLIQQDGGEAVTICVMPSQEGADFSSDVSYTIVDGSVVNLADSQAVKDGMIILNSEVDCHPEGQKNDANAVREVTVNSVNSTDDGKQPDEQDGEEQVTIVMFCQYCGENLNTLEDLKVHLELMHDIEEDLIAEESDSEVSVLPTCEICSATFFEKEQLVAHVKNCKLDKSCNLEASDERKEADDSSGVRKIFFQINDSDSKLVHKCQFCDKAFSVRSLLDRHIEEGHNSDTVYYRKKSYYKCPYCSDIFLLKHRKKSVVNHIRKEHPNESIAVGIHKVVSGGGQDGALEEAHPLSYCPYCDKAFLWQKSMTRHINVSHADRAEELSEDDIMKLSGVKWKRRNLKTRGDSPGEVLGENATAVHSCQRCPKKFLWLKSLKAHCLNDHNESYRARSKVGTLFKCPYCDLVTRYTSSVMKHIQRKHSEHYGLWLGSELPTVEEGEDTSVIRLDKRPPEEKYDEWLVVYKCPLCDFATNNGSNLQRHLVSKKHGNMFTDADIKSIKLASFRIKKGDDPDSEEVERRASLGLEKLRKIVAERNKHDEADSGNTLMVQAATNLKSGVDKCSDDSGDPLSHLHSEDDGNEKENECVIDEPHESNNLATKNVGEIGGKFECPYCDDPPVPMEGLRLHIVRYHTDYVVSKVIKDEPMDTEKNQDQSDNTASNTGNLISSYKCMFCDRSLGDLILLVNHMKNSHFGVAKTPDQINKLVEASPRKSGRKRKAKCFDLYETPTAKSARKSCQKEAEAQDPVSLKKTEKKKVVESKEIQNWAEFDGNKLSDSSTSKSSKNLSSKSSKGPEGKQNAPTVSKTEELGSEDIQCVQKSDAVQLDSNDQTGIFTCPYCGIISKWKKSIYRHIRTVHPEKNENVILKSETSTSNMKKRHPDAEELGSEDIQCVQKSDAVQLDSNDQTGIFTCPYCDITYKWKKSIFRHIRTAHPEKNENVILKSETSTFNMKKRHPDAEELGSEDIQCVQKSDAVQLDSNDQTGIFTCPYCDITYKWKKSIFRHIRTAHPEKNENERMAQSKGNKDGAKCGGMKLPVMISEVSRSDRSTRKSKHPITTPNTQNNLEMTQGKEVPCESVDSIGNSCPHCDFTCKRASALNFHIKLKHSEIKTEPKDSDDQQKSILDSPRRKKASTKSKSIDENKSTTTEKSPAPSKRNSIERDEEEKWIEMEIEEEFEDDRDSDYEPKKDPDFEKFENFTKKVKNIQVMNSSQNQKAILYRCLYCSKEFGKETDIRQHIEVMHQHPTKKAIHAAVKQAAEGKSKTIVYLCPWCNLKSKDKASIFKHVNLDHRRRPYDEKKVKCYEIIMKIKEEEKKVSLRRRKDVTDATKLAKKTDGNVAGDTDDDLDYRGSSNSKQDSFDKELDKDSIDDMDDCFDQNMDKNTDKNSDALSRFVRHFKCPYCELKSEYKKCIIRHVGRCHPEEQDFQIQDIESVGETVLENSAELAGKNIAHYKCSHCSFKSQYKRCAIRHIRRWHRHLGPDIVKFIPVSVDDVEEADTKSGKAEISFADTKSEDETVNFFQCSYCKYVCTSEQGVRTHASAAHPDEPELDMDEIKSIDIGSSNLRNQYKCPYCSLTSLSESTVLTHVANEHSYQTGFKPEDILIQFVSVDEDGEISPVVLDGFDELDEERNDFDVVDMDELDCEIKEDDTKTVKFLRSYRCPFCDVKSQYKKSIIRHIGRWHAENAEKIDNIEYVGEIASKCKREENLHYKCLYCDFVCRSKIGIRQHALVRHPKEPLMTSELIMSIDLSTCKVKNVYRCPFCDLSSIWKSCIIRHVETKHDDVEDFKLDDITSEMVVTDAGNEEEKDPCYFQCLYCQFHSKTRRGIVVHSQAAHPNKPTPSYDDVIVIAPGTEKMVNMFKCPLCAFTSSWRSAINRHMKKRHPDAEELGSEDIQCVQKSDAVQLDSNDQIGIFTCPYCGIINKWKKSILRHIRTIHPEKNENVILKSKTSTSNMDNIQRLPPKILQCVHCSFWCKQVKVMGKHLDKQHPNMGGNQNCNNYKCVYKITKSGASSGNDPEFLYKCHLCGVEYNWKKSLVFHMRTRHEDMFEVFRTLDRVVDIIHTNQPDGPVDSEAGVDILLYNCPYCAERFNWKKSLEIHLRLRHTDKVDSSRTLTDLVETVSHNAENSKQLRSSKVSCGTCRVSFNSVAGLKRHRMMKHGRRSSLPDHTCRTCGSWCRSRAALIQHRLCHHRRQGIRCRQCKRTFLSVYSLGVHQRVAHESKQLVCKHRGCTFSCQWGITMKVHCNSRKHGRVSTQSRKQLAESLRSKRQARLSKRNTNSDVSALSTGVVRCEMCTETFTSTNQLRQHIVKQHSSRQQWLQRRVRVKREYRCRVCNIVFNIQSWRDKHIQEMHPEHAEMCEFCGQLFISEKQLNKHMRVKHREPSESDVKPSIECEQCHQVVLRRSLRKHYLNQHPDCLICQCKVCSDPDSFGKATHTCQTCEMGFCRKIYLQAHNDANHKNWDKNKCKFCGKKFSSVQERNLHLHEQHKDAVTEASIAAMGISGAEPLTLEDTADPETQVLHIGQDQSQQYLPKLTDSSLSAVIKELQIISTDKSNPLPYKCMLCGRCFGKAKYIQLHIRRKHVRDEDQPYRCKLCGSGFVRLTDFRKHSRAHSGFRPYKCKYCSKAFKQSANLTEHMRLHSDTKDFRCEICKQTFQQRGAINAHVSRHDTLKPFKCMFCDKAFSTRGELSRHLQRYDGTNNKSKENRTYTCHICRETFTHFPVLLRHIEMHNPEKPFHCLFCDTRFGSFLSMYNHKVKNDHFYPDEIECETETPKPVRSLRSVRDASSAVAALIKEDDTQIFLDNQSEDTKPIEVVIEPFPSEEIISETVPRNENDELLSIAKQLTELSGYTQYYDVQESEQEALLQKEDEIMKDMLDADSELLANLNKQTTVTKWPKQPWSTEDTVITVEKEAGTASEYVVEQELASPAAVNTIAEMPTNLEDLAALISRNRSTDEALTAYQTEDGSVIYVCMPDQMPETVTAIEEVIEENNSVEHEESNSKTEESVIHDVTHETEVEISDDTVVVESTGQDIVSEELPIVVVSNAEGQMEISEEGVTEVSKEHSGITSISDMSVAEALEHVLYQQMEDTNAVEYIKIAARGDVQAVTDEEQAQGSVQVYPDTSEMYEEKMSDVVEYKNDEKTFIKEELVDASYSKLIMECEYLPREGNFRCSKCGAMCKSKKRLREHFRRHADMKDRQHGCEFCEKRFCTRTELTRHMWTHTDTRNYQCPHCSRKFIQQGHLLDHLKVHRGVKNYSCDKCDMRFRTKSQMKCHWARLHGRRQFQCDQCDRCFTTRQSLVVHQGYNHSSVFGGKAVAEKDEADGIKRPFQCDICGKSYTRKARLDDHMFDHNKVGRYICEVCGDTFRSHSIMKYHYVSKHTERSELCEICCQTFKTRGSLNRHIRVVHQDTKPKDPKPAKPHQCPVCLKMFKTTGSLAYHVGISKKCKEGGPGLQQKGSSLGVQVIDIQND